jgi:hypothetical protein
MILAFIAGGVVGSVGVLVALYLAARAALTRALK